MSRSELSFSRERIFRAIRMIRDRTVALEESCNFLYRGVLRVIVARLACELATRHQRLQSTD